MKSSSSLASGWFAFPNQYFTPSVGSLCRLQSCLSVHSNKLSVMRNTASNLRTFFRLTDCKCVEDNTVKWSELPLSCEWTHTHTLKDHDPPLFFCQLTGALSIIHRLIISQSLWQPLVLSGTHLIRPDTLTSSLLFSSMEKQTALPNARLSSLSWVLTNADHWLGVGRLGNCLLLGSIRR